MQVAFGPAVRQIVEGETRFSKITAVGATVAADVKALDLQQLFLAMTKELRIVVVKLADRLHNMRTLGSMRPEKQRKIASETLQVCLRQDSACIPAHWWSWLPAVAGPAEWKSHGKVESEGVEFSRPFLLAHWHSTNGQARQGSILVLDSSVEVILCQAMHERCSASMPANAAP